MPCTPSRTDRHGMHNTSSHLATLFVLLIALTTVVANLQAGPASSQHSNSASKALSFSRRGLKNANRLGVSGNAIDGNGPAGGVEEEPRPRSINDLVLGNLVLVSSVEGGIYALDRSSGTTKWTLAPRIVRDGRKEVPVADDGRSNASTYEGASPAGFGSLIGTSYGPDQRSFSDLASNIPLVNRTRSSTARQDEVATGHEALDALQKLGLYVVDPSAGQVYVLSSTPDSQGKTMTSLSKLPLSLPQLVELSPFSFPGDNSRVFVGHKSTSLVELDIRSGKIGAVFGGGQNADVWCDTAPTQDDTGSTECGSDGDDVGQWAYIGRTDYTLTIHLRGRPTLSQTLRFSTFAPNSADRDISAIWSREGQSSDHRAVMGMPEEGTVVCFDAKGQASKQGDKDNTLWISELGATAAAIFDVVYPAPHVTKHSRPIIVPHPTMPLRSLFPSVPLSTILPGSSAGSDSALQPQERTTLLGIADGHLYAMGSDDYPLVSFSPRAPAGQNTEGSHVHHEHAQHGQTSTCTSFGCLLGTYDLQLGTEDSIRREGLFDFEVGHAPLLGIGDGRDYDRREEEALNSPAPPYEKTAPITIAPESRSESSKGEKVSTSPWTWNPSPMMVMVQIVALLLLAVLCGLVYVGAQELQRQRTEDAKAVAKNIVWAPRVADINEAVVEEDGKEDKEILLPVRDPEEVARELLREEEAEAIRAEKKKPVKRRKRGKRAGAAVQQREAKRDESSKGDDESGDDDGDDDAGAKVRAVPSNGVSWTEKEENVLQNGWIDVKATADEQAIALAAKTSMGAEGGSTIASSEGPIIARGGQSLLISEEVLGYGSSGTIVFKGTFQGRAVAVKRLLRDFVDVASKEVSLLESADNHPNVIRYFYKEITSTFLFIALELCPASLADIIEKPSEYQELSAQLNPKRALFQIASGLQHLHSLSIVHRDIKPQNILVTSSPGGRLKMLLSDFGLSKRLDGMAQTSFSQTMNNPGGTVGWRAPEILRGDVSLDLGDGSSTTSSTNTTRDGNGNGNDGERKRLTRAVDIFALGCLTYYVLSNGEHPFGSRYEREMNIIRKQVYLQRLDGLGEEGHEAQHLVLAMTQYEAKDRPSATKVMSHPYFWSPARRLTFLQDASDRFDIMEKDPPAPALVALEREAALIVGTDWHRKIDKQFMEDIGKRRKYDGKSVEDLLRAIRNKKHHIHDLPANLKRLLGTLPDGFLSYFTSRFPKLFLHTYEVVDSFALLKSEATFASYFVPVSDDL